jgi:hypothetical protein
MAAAMILLFALTIVLAATGVMTAKTVNVAVPVSMLISSIAFGMGFTGMGQNYSGKRIDYIRSMKTFRQYRFFHQVINLTVSGEFDKAVDVYNKLVDKNNNNYSRGLMFAFVTGAAVFSADEERKKRGFNNLQGMLDAFDPAKVEL